MKTMLYTFTIGCDYCKKQVKCEDKTRDYLPGGWHLEPAPRGFMDGYAVTVDSILNITETDLGKHICEKCYNIKDILE